MSVVREVAGVFPPPVKFEEYFQHYANESKTVPPPPGLRAAGFYLD
jgi:hypothetical protein